MSMPNFEDIPVTTCTMVIKLTHKIDHVSSFHFLPITRLDTQASRGSSKCKLPHCSTPGAILSMKHDGMVRGIIKNNKSGLKNSVTIDISISHKNISAKLAPSSIHMCGLKSTDDAYETANLLIDHVRAVQRVLDLIHGNLEAAHKAVDWVKEHTKGPDISRANWQLITSEKVTLRIDRSEMCSSIIKPSIPVPDDVDLKIANFLLSFCDDFVYYHDLAAKLDCVFQVKQIIPPELEIEVLNEHMVNFNYSLGFSVDRSRLSRLINGRSGFIASFNNGLAHGVKIELPYELTEEMAARCKKDKIPHHTILVYKTGSVTQSGPNRKMMRDVYYMFIDLVSELRPDIEAEPAL